MSFGNAELWAAFFANLTITAIYLAVVASMGQVPAASEAFGHGLGIVGFILMLMTETLYSIRKRMRLARWGRMAYWLKFHIFTGLVGPSMVLLHTSWKFAGLAGVVMLLTVVVVVSGFIGRYIYTAIPRTVNGLALEEEEVDRMIREAETALQQWLQAQSQRTRQVVQEMLTVEERLTARLPPALLLWVRPLVEGYYRWRWWREKRRLGRLARAEARKLDRPLARRRPLRRQRAMLLWARRALALWHTLHVPLGAVLFTLAFVHICAALYYALLTR